MIKKTFFKKHNIVIAGVCVTCTAIATTAFFLNREKASILSKDTNDSITQEVSDYTIKNSIFVTYDTTSSNTIRLFKQTYEEVNKCDYVFVDKDDNIVFKTSDNVEYFKMLNDFTIVAYTIDINTNLNRNTHSVKVYNLNDSTSNTIYSGKSLAIEVCKNKVYILNKDNNSFVYGDIDNLKTINLNFKAKNLITNKDKVFLVEQYVDNSKTKSRAYYLNKDVFEKIYSYDGKISNISVDYNNRNKLYLLLESTDDLVTQTAVIYIDDRSPLNIREQFYPNLTGNIISLKERNYLINRKTYEIYLLNSNLTIFKKVDDIHKSIIWKLVKEDSISENLYYIDSSNSFTKL